MWSIFSKLFGNKNNDIKLTYTKTIYMTLGIKIEENEDLDTIKTKSIDFTEQILKINGRPVPHFKVYANEKNYRGWIAGKPGEFGSMIISVYINKKRVEFGVMVPAIDNAILGIQTDDIPLKPSIQIFRYNEDVKLKDINIEVTL